MSNINKIEVYLTNNSVISFTTDFSFKELLKNSENNNGFIIIKDNNKTTYINTSHIIFVDIKEE